MVEQQTESVNTDNQPGGLTKQEIRVALYRLQGIISEIPDEECDPRIRLRIQECLEMAELLNLKLYPLDIKNQEGA